MKNLFRGGFMTWFMPMIVILFTSDVIYKIVMLVGEPPPRTKQNIAWDLLANIAILIWACVLLREM